MNLSHAQGEQLAQITPAVTTAVTLFQASTLRTEITLLFACNHNAGAIVIELFHDDNGTTYDNTTKIGQISSSPNDADIVFQAHHPGSGITVKPGGSIGVKIDAANDVTFSVYGISEHVAERFGSKNV